MKTEIFTCDICEFKTNDEMKIFDATIRIGEHRGQDFHVCKTCWVEAPKSVFKKAFDMLCRVVRIKK